MNKNLAFSVVGSFIVILLDIQFIIEQFKINFFIAFLMMAYIEGLYLYLPYLLVNTARSGWVRFADKLLYAGIFILSVTGASLQASKYFVDTYNVNSTYSISKEENKNDKEFYQNQIKENAKQLNKINDIPVKNQTWAQRNQIERLTIDNAEYAKLLKTIRSDNKTEDKNVKESDIKNTDTWLSHLFDLIRVFFSFTIVIFIQWGNGRISNIGSKEIKVQQTIVKTEPDKPEPELEQEPEKKKTSSIVQPQEPEVHRTQQHPLPTSK